MELSTGTCIIKIRNISTFMLVLRMGEDVVELQLLNLGSC